MFGYAQLHEIDDFGATTADYERWRRTRCGVCRAIGQRYGHIARFGLNVDAVFLALVLDRHRDADDTAAMPTVGHCMRHDVARTEAAQRDHLPFDLGALANGLGLAVGLDDHVTDERGTRRMAARTARLAVGGKRLRERAERDARAIDLDPARVHRDVDTVEDVERDHGATPIDAWLAPVGDATGATFEQAERARQQRCEVDDAEAIETMRDLGDALGRVVLLLDAVDDADADARRGRPNALRALLEVARPSRPCPPNASQSGPSDRSTPASSNREAEIERGGLSDWPTVDNGWKPMPLGARAEGCALALREIARAQAALARLCGDVRVPRLILDALAARVKRRRALLAGCAVDSDGAGVSAAAALTRAASFAPLTTIANEDGGGVPWGIVVAVGIGLFCVVACCSDASRNRKLKEARKGRRASGTAAVGPACDGCG